ncbi:Nodulation-signaling pathway 2 protein [Camellia lanceoleosa]|uniref:Nodulation-signaling pathway 2 protein n=1 Tax=Camellia lanceoleosa TaxID=1840588 RepID=A0ACC0HPX3_9ERIC|nr:Nodulation-signaling pathway 2 protein [Camellia lanceoleosa]
MMQSELFQLSWPSFTNLNSSFNEDKAYILDNMDAHMGHSDFSIFSDEFIDFPVHVDELDFMLPKDDFSSDFEEFENMFSSGEIGEMATSLESEETPFQLPFGGEDQRSVSQSSNSSVTSMDVVLSQPSLILPTNDMEIDNSLGLVHLVQAYGEAMEKDQIELVEVIMKSIGEKVSPVGEIVERLLYYLFQPSDKQSDYLKQESSKNFHAAFKAFYQIFPYGKFAHFAANLAILEAIPPDVEIIHIVDFDIGEGTQWSSVIEAIGCQQREIRLTSIKWTKGDSNHDHTSGWRFDETKRRLLDHASYFGLNLKVEEMELHNLESEKKKMKKRGGRREWRAFNCMVELPHMGRVRSRRQVMEFLKVAKDVLSIQTPYCNSSTKGIITFGDADGWEILKKASSFGSFLDGYVVHYQALLESMESTFPIQFGDARIALECLFVAPFVSSLSWIERWHEREEFCDFQKSYNGLEGWRVSKESLMEAKEMVREGVSPYGVVVEGDNNNEMILEWRGVPLVRVSFWRN